MTFREWLEEFKACHEKQPSGRYELKDPERVKYLLSLLSDEKRKQIREILQDVGERQDALGLSGEQTLGLRPVNEGFVEQKPSWLGRMRKWLP